MLPNYLPESGPSTRSLRRGRGGGGSWGDGEALALFFSNTGLQKWEATTCDSSPYIKLLTVPLFMLHFSSTNVMVNDKPREYKKMAFVQSVTHVIQEPSGYLMRCFTTEETQGIQEH